MKKCPFCAEEIQDEAVKCRFCGEWIKPPSDKGAVLDEENNARINEELGKDLKAQLESIDSMTSDEFAKNLIEKGKHAQDKYKHKTNLSYEEAVKWLVKEAKTSDRLAAIANEMAYDDSLYKFQKYFVRKEVEREEKRELSNLVSDFWGREMESGSWKWIDVLKAAFLEIGDKGNAKKVEDAVVAEFGDGNT